MTVYSIKQAFVDYDFMANTNSWTFALAYMLFYMGPILSDMLVLIMWFACINYINPEFRPQTYFYK